jgi:hypothetical protein
MSKNNNKVDNVNHPKHYEGNTSLECIEAMRIAFGVKAVRWFCLCNAFKYTWRHKHKNGAEDIFKSDWYLKYCASTYTDDDNIPHQYDELRKYVDEHLDN